MRIKPERLISALILFLFVCLPVARGGDIPTRQELQAVRAEMIEGKRRALTLARAARASSSASLPRGYDANYYQLDLSFDIPNESITGELDMRATSLIDGLTAVDLDFAANMVVDNVSGGATFVHDSTILTVTLPAAKDSGATFQFSISYHGQPQFSGFGAFGFNIHGPSTTPVIWSLSEPYGARAWWPCNDAPSDKADSADIILTVPNDLIAVSNGSLISTDIGATHTTYHWHESYPIPTYLISVAISNYTVETDFFDYGGAEPMPLKYYIYPESVDGALGYLPAVNEMITLFHDIFGPYPFLTEKYAIAQFPWGGGMEHQTATSQGRFTSTTLNVHELAHQWFGDMITMKRWGDIWLNEGFASYAEALYYEWRDGAQALHNYLAIMDIPFAYPIFVDDTTSVSRIFNITVYDKGGWLLHMLRHVVGDSTFFDILLAYTADPRFAYGNASSEDFIGVCEAVSGMDLTAFFQAWLYQAKRPVYDVTWSPATIDGEPTLYMRITQEQANTYGVFPLPVIDILVSTAAGDTLLKIQNDDAVQRYIIPLAGDPLAIALDPDNWILKGATSITLDTDIVQLPVTFELLNNYPNPFNAGTEITFTASMDEEIKLTAYNILGQEVDVIFEGRAQSGHNEIAWDGRGSDGAPLPSGVYFYRLEAKHGRLVGTRKMLLIK